jgi:hypothetical protein
LSDSVGVYNNILGIILESDHEIIGSYLKVDQEILNGTIYQNLDGPIFPIMNREQVIKNLNK